MMTIITWGKAYISELDIMVWMSVDIGRRALLWNVFLGESVWFIMELYY